MAINGSDILLQVNTGTTQSPAYTDLVGQTNVEFTITNDNIDVSDKSSSNRKWDYGMGSESATVDFFFLLSDSTLSALKDAIRNRTKLLIRKRDDNVGTDIETATAVISDFTETHPLEDVSVITVTINIDGVWS